MQQDCNKTAHQSHRSLAIAIAILRFVSRVTTSNLEICVTSNLEICVSRVTTSNLEICVSRVTTNQFGYRRFIGFDCWVRVLFSRQAHVASSQYHVSQQVIKGSRVLLNRQPTGGSILPVINSTHQLWYTTLYIKQGISYTTSVMYTTV